MKTQLPSRVRAVPDLLFHSTCSALGVWPRARRLPADWKSVPVFCVTTAKAKRRQKIIDNQNHRLGFESLRYLVAPDLSSVSLDELELQGLYSDDSAQKFHGRSLRHAEVSCSLAHGLVYEKLVALNLPYALVIEDDALFIGRRFQQLKIADIPDDFDVVLLNAEREPRYPNDALNNVLCGVDSYRASSCAYLVSQTGAQKLNANYKPVIHAADGFLGRSMELPAGTHHPFKRMGARTTLRCYMTIQDFVLNGSCCYYYNSAIRGLPDWKKGFRKTLA